MPRPRFLALTVLLLSLAISAGAARAQEGRPAAEAVADSSVAPVTYLYGNAASIRSRGVDRVRRRVARIAARHRTRRPLAPVIVLVPGAGTALPASPSPVVAKMLEVEQALLTTGLFRTGEVAFASGRSTLSPGSEGVLDAVGTVLVRYPQLRLEVSGHTDDVGDEAFNRRLSEARAQAVRQYLIDRFSLPPDRLTARGYGEAQPVASNDLPAGRALNRRVEFRVLP